MKTVFSTRNMMLCVLGLCLALTTGCSEAPKARTPRDAGTSHAPPFAGGGHAGSAHFHPATGPHGGPIIELGRDDCYAEMVHDDEARIVTIYLLDSAAKEPHAIASAEVVISLKHDGTRKQFRIQSAPQELDAEGKSSRFVSGDKELSDDLDREGAAARLVVEIDGKSYTGTLPHEHDHWHNH